MKIKKTFTLPEFVEFLVKISRKNIPDIAKDLSLNVATVYNWKTGKTKRVNKKQIVPLSGRLKEKYSIGGIGEVTTFTIELLEIPVQAEGEEKIQIESKYVSEVSYLLNKLKYLEFQNDRLYSEVKRLKQKYEPGRPGAADPEGEELSLFSPGSEKVFYAYSQVI